MIGIKKIIYYAPPVSPISDIIILILYLMLLYSSDIIISFYLILEIDIHLCVLLVCVFLGRLKVSLKVQTYNGEIYNFQFVTCS